MQSWTECKYKEDKNFSLKDKNCDQQQYAFIDCFWQLPAFIKLTHLSMKLQDAGKSEDSNKE